MRVFLVIRTVYVSGSYGHMITAVPGIIYGSAVIGKKGKRRPRRNVPGDAIR